MSEVCTMCFRDRSTVMILARKIREIEPVIAGWEGGISYTDKLLHTKNFLDNLNCCEYESLWMSRFSTLKSDFGTTR